MRPTTRPPHRLSSRRARLLVLGLAVLCVAATELALETWWLPSKWRTYEAAVPLRPQVSEDGRTLTLTVSWTCEQRPELVAHESADEVDVVLRRKAFRGPDYQCPPDSVGSARITAHLRAPLAARPLLDTRTGRPLP
ncbi:hypothetical protein [Kitasatospora sp. NPDC093806]|uniref:hypothetical protein n=1 Tax=Kitasatospora sp. NPDC093806 TaxID=3155075 RepID=UPI00341B1904